MKPTQYVFMEGARSRYGRLIPHIMIVRPCSFVDRTHSRTPLRQDVEEWLNNHAGFYGWEHLVFSTSVHFAFSKEDVALLFKLTWCGE